MGCCREFHHVHSGGRRLTISIIWSSWSRVLHVCISLDLGQKQFPSCGSCWLDRFKSDATRELSAVGFVVAALGSAALQLLSLGGSHIIAEAYVEYLVNEYKERLVEYPILELRLLKGCLQKVATSVFGCFDPFSMTAFITSRLKRARHRNWMISRPRFRLVIIANEFQMPSLVEVVANIVGFWPLTVS